MHTILNTSSVNQSALKAINLSTPIDNEQQGLVDSAQNTFCLHHHPLQSTYDALTAAALVIAGFPYQYHVSTGKTSQGVDTYVSFKIYSPHKIVYVYLTDKRLLNSAGSYNDNSGKEENALITHAQAAFQQDTTNIPFHPLYTDMPLEYFYQYLIDLIIDLDPNTEFTDFSICYEHANEYLKQQKLHQKSKIKAV